LAVYEDTIDAVRLARDPAMQEVAGLRGAERLDSQMTWAYHWP